MSSDCPHRAKKVLEDKIAALNNNTSEADNDALQKELQQLRSSSNEVE